MLLIINGLWRFLKARLPIFSCNLALVFCVKALSVSPFCLLFRCRLFHFWLQLFLILPAWWSRVCPSLSAMRGQGHSFIWGVIRSLRCYSFIWSAKRSLRCYSFIWITVRLFEVLCGPFCLFIGKFVFLQRFVEVAWNLLLKFSFEDICFGKQL